MALLRHWARAQSCVSWSLSFGIRFNKLGSLGLVNGITSRPRPLGVPLRDYAPSIFQHFVAGLVLILANESLVRFIVAGGFGSGSTARCGFGPAPPRLARSSAAAVAWRALLWLWTSSRLSAERREVLIVNAQQRESILTREAGPEKCQAHRCRTCSGGCVSRARRRRHHARLGLAENVQHIAGRWDFFENHIGPMAGLEPLHPPCRPCAKGSGTGTAWGTEDRPESP